MLLLLLGLQTRAGLFSRIRRWLLLLLLLLGLQTKADLFSPSGGRPKINLLRPPTLPV